MTPRRSALSTTKASPIARRSRPNRALPTSAAAGWRPAMRGIPSSLSSLTVWWSAGRVSTSSIHGTRTATPRTSPSTSRGLHAAKEPAPRYSSGSSSLGARSGSISWCSRASPGMRQASRSIAASVSGRSASTGSRACSTAAGWTSCSWSGSCSDAPRTRCSMSRIVRVKRRIGILTGGGDVPGLNPVIKSVVYRSTELGYEVLGIRRGWEGLTHMRPGRDPDPEYIRPLDRGNTRAIDRTGGTILHTSRTNPRKMKAERLPPFLDERERERFSTNDGMYDLTPIVLRNIESLDLDYLVTIGGDDTLSFSEALARQGISLIAVPKTMDNDVQGTEYCIGFSTAMTRAKELIDRQRTTLGSHERIGIFRIFGRDAGLSALHAAYVTSAH